MKTRLSLLFIALLITFTGAAMAQTPDGDPPSVEEVCDGLTGAEYGLCTAYCEAMDCDAPDLTQAAQEACDRVRQNWINKGGEPNCEECCDNPVICAVGEANICDCAPCVSAVNASNSTLNCVQTAVADATKWSGACAAEALAVGCAAIPICEP